MHKPYGNNGAVDASELDPCLAAEARMKQTSVLSDRMKIILIGLGVVILLLVVIGLILLLIGNGETWEKPYDEPVLVKKGDWPTREPALFEESTTAEPYRPEPTKKSYNFDYASISTKLTSSTSTTSTTTTTTATTTTPTSTSTTTLPPTTTFTTTTTTTTPPPTTIIRVPSLIPIEEEVTATPSTTTSPTTAAAPIYTVRTKEARTRAATQPAPTVAVHVYSSLQALPTNVPLTNDVRENCMDHKVHSLGSGIYLINPDGDEPFKVFCDMETDGGGWTVIQRRLNGAEDFHTKSFTQYKEGFGNLMKEHWIGLQYIHRIAPATKEKQILRIELRGDTCTNAGCSGLNDDGFWWGEWDFALGGPDTSYTLSLGENQKKGNMTNPTINKSKLRWDKDSNGMKFTAWEIDNDKNKDLNCAVFRNYGGWWHKDCTVLALNGKYGDRFSQLRGLAYYRDGDINAYNIKPRQSLMMLRPPNY